MKDMELIEKIRHLEKQVADLKEEKRELNKRIRESVAEKEEVEKDLSKECMKSVSDESFQKIHICSLNKESTY